MVQRKYHHLIQITLYVENLDMVEDGTVSD